MTKDRFLSGDQQVEDGFSGWAGSSYKGARISPLRNLSTYNFQAVSFRSNLNFSCYKDWHEAVSRLLEYFHSRIVPAIRDGVARGVADPWLEHYETEAAEKMMVSWRVRGIGRQVFASEFYASSPQQANDLAPELRRRGLAYVQMLQSKSDTEIAECINDSKIRLDKAKGAPFFQGGSDIEAGLSLACLSRKLRSFERVNDVLGAVSGGVKLRMLMSERIQGNRKPVSLRVVRDGRIVAHGQGLLCKVRTVKAPPFVHNNNVAWFFNLHKWLMLQIWPEHHVLQPINAAERMSKYTQSFSSDMSTFDDTIAVETLDLWRDVIARPILSQLVRRSIIQQWQADYFLSYDESVTRGEILCPARYKTEKACVLRMTGGVKSGERGTSSKDNDVASARATSLLKILSRDRADSFLSWGDDLVILTNDKTLQDRWTRCEQQRHLFNEKVAPGAVFLMKMSQFGHGFMMRSLSRRVNLEKKEEPADWLEQAISLRASYESMTDLKHCRRPHCAAHLFFEAAGVLLGRDAPSVRMAQIATYDQLSHAYIKSRSTTPLARDFLKSDLYHDLLLGDNMPEQEDRRLIDRAMVISRWLAPGLNIPLAVRHGMIDKLANQLHLEGIINGCKK